MNALLAYAVAEVTRDYDYFGDSAYLERSVARTRRRATTASQTTRSSEVDPIRVVIVAGIPASVTYQLASRPEGSRSRSDRRYSQSVAREDSYAISRHCGIRARSFSNSGFGDLPAGSMGGLA